MCDCSGGCGSAKKKPDKEPSEKQTCASLCTDKPKIKAKKASYVVVLDKTGNLKSGYPILEFEITDGCPNCYIDIQVAKGDSSLLSGGPGISGAWDKTKPAKDRIKQKAFSSWTNGQTSLKLDGSGKGTYKMPLEWWRDLARQPLSTFTTQKIYFRVVSACDANATSTNDSSISNIEVHNNLVEMKVVDKGYINGGLNKSVSMEFKVREANTTEMYTIVQWNRGSNRIWGGTRTYAVVTDYGISHDSNIPEWAIDRLRTNPRYADGVYTISGGGKKATTTDAPGGAIGASDTHDFFTLDFDTRLHLNFEVPATVTVTKKEGSAPIWGIVIGKLADPQPITLANDTWNFRILQIRTATGVTVSHPNTYGGP